MRHRIDQTDDASTRTAHLALVALSSVIAIAVLIATASGLGVSPDGVAYLSLAEEFRTNGSPYALLAPSPTHYAPLWAMLVGGVAAITPLDGLLEIGRWINVALTATIPWLVYGAVRREARARAWWALLAAAVGSLSFGLFRLSVRALTEPLFVVLILVSLLLIGHSLRHRSRPVLFGAAAVAGAAVLTRFAGAALLVPLAVAAWPLGASLGRRALDTVGVGVLAIGPTALWALAAPTATTSTHLESGPLAGLGDLAQSIIEAGYVAVDPPSAGFADPIYLVLGAVVLLGPLVAAVGVARSAHTGIDGDSAVQRLGSTGLLPWLSFLLSYGALISVQRWWIGREVIDRYWVPWFVVGVVLVARSVAVLGLLEHRRLRTAFATGAMAIAVLNLGLVVAFAATRATDGIELNEVRYQRAELFDQLDAADVEVVVTDSARLVELHLVALRGAEVVVRDADCSWSGESRAVELARSASAPTAVALLGFCDVDATRDELSALPGTTVTTEPGIGTLALIDVGNR